MSGDVGSRFKNIVDKKYDGIDENQIVENGLTVLPDTWSISSKGKAAIRLANSIHKTKHGLFASVPIVCKGDLCPYNDTCFVYHNGLAPDGERCPVEIASIVDKYDRYCHTFNIDPDHNDYVVTGLIKRAIDAEVMIDRCDHILAREGEIIQEVVVGVTENGREVRKPEIHQAIIIKQREEKRLNEALRLLNSTPKDKAGEMNAVLDVSQYAANLRSKAEELRQKMEKESIEVEYTETQEGDGDEH